MSDEIRPFRIEIPQSDVDDLHARLAAARWPDELPGVGRARGIPLEELRELADYWRTGFDWRAQEARLNAYPQFTTEIDGQTIHFIHVRSGQPDALTLVLTHGFPSSVAEFTGLIDRLTRPGERTGVRPRRSRRSRGMRSRRRWPRPAGPWPGPLGRGSS